MAAPPRPVEQRRHQDVLPAPDRVGVDANQPQQAGRCRLETVAEGDLVAQDRSGRGRERPQHRQRHPVTTARGVDRPVHGTGERVDPRRRLIPAGQPVPPQLCCPLGLFIRGSTISRGIGFVDPRPEVGRLE